MERTNAARGETAASPHVILRMLNTHWAVQIMSDVARLGVFDLVQARGPLTAHELTADGGVPARAILRTCARRLAPGGRLLCVEAVLPEVGDTADVSNKLLDVHMLLTLGGRERTRSEWETLCRSAGLMLHAITAVPGVPGTCAIDARPA